MGKTYDQELVYLARLSFKIKGEIEFPRQAKVKAFHNQ